MIEPDRAALLELATELATEAGELIETMRSELETGGMAAASQTKSSSVDIVTLADRAAEASIIAGVVGARPEDAILGEEGADRDGTSGVRWLVDPIDGTTNYVYGLPAYTVSIAAEFNGQLVAAVVFEPKGDRLFQATLGGGARRNGDPIRCTAKDELSTALVATGFGYQRERRRGQAEVLLEILPRVRDIRRFGSAALDLCLLASGQVDAYFERGLNPWDFAAGALIATEAGATVEDLWGGEPNTTFLLGAGPALFSPLRDLLRQERADLRP